MIHQCGYCEHDFKWPGGMRFSDEPPTKCPSCNKPFLMYTAWKRDYGDTGIRIRGRMDKY